MSRLFPALAPTSLLFQNWVYSLVSHLAFLDRYTGTHTRWRERKEKSSQRGKSRHFRYTQQTECDTQVAQMLMAASFTALRAETTQVSLTWSGWHVGGSRGCGQRIAWLVNGATPTGRGCVSSWAAGNSLGDTPSRPPRPFLGQVVLNDARRRVPPHRP